MTFHKMQYCVKYRQLPLPLVTMKFELGKYIEELVKKSFNYNSKLIVSELGVYKYVGSQDCTFIFIFESKEKFRFFYDDFIVNMISK